MSLSEPSPPAPDWPRYAPDIDWPPYRYLPGSSRHPLRHPEGHLRGRELPEPRYLPAESWSENRPYLMGVDLFNQVFWWEAHEAWEGLWHLADEDKAMSFFLKGLIQAAAALLQRHQRQESGSQRLFRRSLENLEETKQLVAAPIYMGLTFDALTDQLHETFSQAQSPGSNEPVRVLITLDRPA